MAGQVLIHALPRALGLPALLLCAAVAISPPAWAGPEGGRDQGWSIGDLEDPPVSGLDLSLPEGDFEAEPIEIEPPEAKAGRSTEYLSPADRYSRARRESFELHETLRLQQRD